jgi:hypothetical protein
MFDIMDTFVIFSTSSLDVIYHLEVVASIKNIHYSLNEGSVHCALLLPKLMWI